MKGIWHDLHIVHLFCFSWFGFGCQYNTICGNTIGNTGTEISKHCAISLRFSNLSKVQYFIYIYLYIVVGSAWFLIIPIVYLFNGCDFAYANCLQIHLNWRRFRLYFTHVCAKTTWKQFSKGPGNGYAPDMLQTIINYGAVQWRIYTSTDLNSIAFLRKLNFDVLYRFDQYTRFTIYSRETTNRYKQG